ncbi:hypothetical protein BpHYR1_027795 [Brachionus plicatilis]|uniref:Uncharacterized protein n=1 Tax=Brachionus plicatilis TaxID=10195 RepID=A0A3M7RU95_BRAPC|nr:hypothetical protein BpHYR1_027795 [Brachionus plicatilis]
MNFTTPSKLENFLIQWCYDNVIVIEMTINVILCFIYSSYSNTSTNNINCFPLPIVCSLIV